MQAMFWLELMQMAAWRFYVLQLGMSAWMLLLCLMNSSLLMTACLQVQSCKTRAQSLRLSCLICHRTSTIMPPHCNSSVSFGLLISSGCGLAVRYLHTGWKLRPTCSQLQLQCMQPNALDSGTCHHDCLGSLGRKSLRERTPGLAILSFCPQHQLGDRCELAPDCFLGPELSDS